MKRWIVGGVAVLCAGAGVGFWLAKTEPRDNAGRPELPPVVVSVPTPAAVVLADVVEVADLDALLDPRAKDTGGAPFETDPPATVPVSTPTTPERIPPAID
jgi:hypothetical protein